MDSTSIKLEPGTSAEENACETSPTEHSNLEKVTIKAEPKIEEIEISYSGADIKLPDIKKECLEQSERIHQMEGEISITEFSHQEGVTIKAEQGIKEEAESGLLCSEIDIELPDIKKECLEHFERTPQTAEGFPKKQPEKKQYSCLHCDYSCSRKSTSVIHLRTHTKEKPFFCADCNYTCSFKRYLQTHMYTHRGEKSFSCRYCDYSCFLKAKLKVHMLTHSAKKSFLCPDCNYSCWTKRSLKIHMFIHSAKKPFSCADCNYSCSRKNDLKIHMFTHSGQKPYSCPVCDYSSSRKGHLKRHMHTHSGKNLIHVPTQT